jgi:hypothetical protein
MTCSSPKNVSTPNNLKHKVYGSYANLYLPGNLKNKSGEIIEVNAKEIKLLQKGEVISVSKDLVQSCIISVSLTVNDPKKINTWASLINLMSIGHGLFGVISLPINVLATNGITKSKYTLKYPDNMSWDKIQKFARFPQGIPKNIDLKEIQ